MLWCSPHYQKNRCFYAVFWITICVRFECIERSRCATHTYALSFFVLLFALGSNYYYMFALFFPVRLFYTVFDAISHSYRAAEDQEIMNHEANVEQIHKIGLRARRAHTCASDAFWKCKCVALWAAYNRPILMPSTLLSFCHVFHFFYFAFIFSFLFYFRRSGVRPSLSRCCVRAKKLRSFSCMMLAVWTQTVNSRLRHRFDGPYLSASRLFIKIFCLTPNSRHTTDDLNDDDDKKVKYFRNASHVFFRFILIYSF